jgi:hypothetical protein
VLASSWYAIELMMLWCNICRDIFFASNTCINHSSCEGCIHVWGGGAQEEVACIATALASRCVCKQVKSTTACGRAPTDLQPKDEGVIVPATHADKNPVLTDIATEVTKIINEAVAEAEASLKTQQP